MSYDRAFTAQAENQMLRRFVEVVGTATNLGFKIRLDLTAIQLTTLHGAVALAMKHPDVPTKLKGANEVLMGIREQLKAAMLAMGFTRDEVTWLDKREA